VSGVPADAGKLHLLPLPDQLRRREPPVPPDVLALVDAEHARWRALHDRLIALIAALLDVAVAGGRPLAEVIDELIAGTTVPLDTLVAAGLDPADVAGLLRAHGSTGSVAVEGPTTTFTHECGSGLRYWRDTPGTPTVAEGEVPGVPAGRPRYCARCIRTIAGQGPGWTVDPPADPGERCTWTVTTAEGGLAVGDRHGPPAG
jgi:hypothetical protein